MLPKTCMLKSRVSGISWHAWMNSLTTATAITVKRRRQGATCLYLGQPRALSDSLTIQHASADGPQEDTYPLNTYNGLAMAHGRKPGSMELCRLSAHVRRLYAYPPAPTHVQYCTARCRGATMHHRLLVYGSVGKVDEGLL